MKKHWLVIGALCCSMAAVGQVIPNPTTIQRQNVEMSCSLNQLKTVYLETQNQVVRDILQKEFFQDVTLTTVFNEQKLSADIAFIRDASIVHEGYSLVVSPEKISVKASDDSGFLYAVQTLRQLVRDSSSRNKSLPCVTIDDAPRKSYRSLMLDSGRQYQRVETLKKYLDLLCMLKMNYFHWHLTEGLGWRIQIKQYPLLTSVGAYVGSGKEQHGFYTQEEMKELVKYAAERGITIIPEIDIPGHSSAALTAYPSLCCFNEPIRIPTIGFTEQIFCAGKDATLKFLKNVLDEVCEIFPSEYIHIGGDEAPKGNWNKCPDCQKRIKDLHLKNAHELQLWLTSEIATHLKRKGRKAICWGDVVYHRGYDLPDNIVVQWWNWRGHKDLAVKEAKRRGLKVICSSNYYTYLNFPLKPWRGYSKGRTFDLYDAYTANPSYEKLDDESVLGMGAALWTDDELVESMLDERLFPRIFALAEQMWHKGDLLPFEDFYHLIQEKENWFWEKGYDYGPAFKDDRQFK